MDAKEAFFKAMGWTEDAKDLSGQMNLPGFEEPKTPKVTQPSLPGASKWKQKSPKAKGVGGADGGNDSPMTMAEHAKVCTAKTPQRCPYARKAAEALAQKPENQGKSKDELLDEVWSEHEELRKRGEESEGKSEEGKKNPEALESPEKVDVGGTDLEVKDQTQAAAADLLKEYLDDPNISEEKKEGAKAIIEKLQQTIKQNDAASSSEEQVAKKEEEAAKHEEAIAAGKEMGAEVASAEGQMDLLIKNHEQALAGLAQQIEALGGKEPETTALKNELDKENKKFAKEFQKLDPVEQSADGTQETPEDHAKHCKANPKSNCPFLKSAMSEEQLKQLDAQAATEDKPQAEAAATGEEPPKDGEAEQEPHNSIEWDKDRYEREYKNSPEAEKIRDVFRKMLDEGVTEFDVEYNPYLMQLLNEVLAEKGATKVQYINEADLSEVDEIKPPLDTRPGIIGKNDWTPAQKAALEDLARRFGAAVEGIKKGVDDTKFTRLLNDINRFKAVKSRWASTPNVSAPRNTVREALNDMMDGHVDKTYSDSTVDVIEKLLAQDVLVNKAVSASIKGDLEYIQGILTDPQATTKEVRDANKMYRSLIEKYGLDEVLEGGKDSRAGETVQGYLEDGDENHRKGGVVSSNNEYPDWKINIENVADEKEGNGSVNNSDEIKEKIRNDLSKKNFPAEIDDIKETNYISTTDFTFKFPKDMKVTKSLIADLKQEIARNFPLAEDKNLSINYNDRTDTLTVTVENDNKGFVSQKRLLQSKEFQDAVNRGEIAIALGLDEKGNPVIGNLTDYIHVLLAGQTGSGKSARLGSILSSLMMQSPDNFKMILIDPKKVEFGRYKNDPHLIGDVVTEGKDAVKRLNYLVNEQENRYRLFEKAGVSNLQEYNAKGAEGKLPEGLPTHLPSIGLFIDEFGNLMGTHGKDIEGLVKQLGEKSRAAGVHLVLATQRPTAKNIPTDIRANIPTTIGLNARDWRESGYIGIEGLEYLPQKGPLIIKSPDGKTTKVDGSFMNGDRISTLVKSSIANKKGPGAQENKGNEETQSIITPPKESATSEPTDNTGTKQRPGDSAKPQATSEKKEGSGLPSPAETQRQTERETVKENLREAYDIQHGAFDETINDAKKRYDEAIQKAKTNTQKKAALDEYTRAKDMALSQINDWRSRNGISSIQDINADGSYQIEKFEEETSAGEPAETEEVASSEEGATEEKPLSRKEYEARYPQTREGQMKRLNEERDAALDAKWQELSEKGLSPAQIKQDKGYKALIKDFTSEEARIDEQFPATPAEEGKSGGEGTSKKSASKGISIKDDVKSLSEEGKMRYDAALRRFNSAIAAAKEGLNNDTLDDDQYMESVNEATEKLNKTRSSLGFSTAVKSDGTFEEAKAAEPEVKGTAPLTDAPEQEPSARESKETIAKETQEVEPPSKRNRISKARMEEIKSKATGAGEESATTEPLGFASRNDEEGGDLPKPTGKVPPKNPPPEDDNTPDGGGGGVSGGGTGESSAEGTSGGETTEPAPKEPEKPVDKEEPPTPKPEAPEEEEGDSKGKSSKKQDKSAKPAENMQPSKKESAPERVETDTPADAFTRGTENLEKKTRKAMQSDPSIQALQAQVVKAKAEHGENSKEYKTASRMLESGQRRFTEAFRKSQEEDSGVKDMRTKNPSPQKPEHSTTAPTKEKAPEKQVPEKTKPTKESPKETREKASSSTKEKEPEKEPKQEPVKKSEPKQKTPKKEVSGKPEDETSARTENKESPQTKPQPKAGDKTTAEARASNIKTAAEIYARNLNIPNAAQHPINVKMANELVTAIEKKDAKVLLGKLGQGNEMSREAFEKITGTKLPNSPKELKKVIADYCGNEAEPEKASPQPQQQSQKAKTEEVPKKETPAPKPASNEPEKKVENTPSTTTSEGETPQMKAYRERQEAREKAEKEAKEKTAKERARRFEAAQQSQQKNDRDLNKQSAEFAEAARKEADTSKSKGFKTLSKMKPLKKVDNATANDINRQFEEISAEIQELSEKLKSDEKLSKEETRQTVGLIETLRKGLEDVVKDKRLGAGNFHFRHLRDSDGKVVGTQITKFRDSDGKMKDVEEIKEEVKEEKAPTKETPSTEETKTESANQEFGSVSRIREKGKQKTSDLEKRMKEVLGKKGKGANAQDEALPEGWFWDEEISDSPDSDDYIWHEIFDAAIVAMG